MGKRKHEQNKKARGSVLDRIDEFVEEVYSRDEAHLALSAIVHDLGHIPEIGYTKSARLLAQALLMADKLQELDRRILRHSSTLEKLEADVDVLKKEKREIHEEQGWPWYASEDFAKIVENIQNLENAVGDKPQILYRIMELETLLGRLEKKARATNRKYEARLTASLRDICRVHEPSELSKEQIKCFKHSITVLVEGWGKLNREKVGWIRSRLLDVELTWLPVTDKALKDISEAQQAKA